jgi:L-galactose dehydrogenase
VDLLIAHDIEFVDREQIVAETIPAMRRVQEAGKARFIGISGLPLRVLADVAERGRVDFVLSYCRYTLLNRDLDRWLTPVLEKHNIGLILAAPLNMGILSSQGPPPWHLAQPEIKEIGRKVYELCRDRGIDSASAAVAFALKHPYAASVLVGMPRVAEVEQNLRALEFVIPPELMRDIDELAEPVKHLIWPSGRPENDD